MTLLFIFISLIFQLTFKPSLQAEGLYDAIAPKGNFIPEEQAFQPIFKAYHNLAFERAIEETRFLKRTAKDRETKKTAAYLLGDLYLVMAERGRPKLFDKALNAFLDARVQYPDSEQAITALLKIGTIYSRDALYYEAIASFNRILHKYPRSRFVISAHLKKGEVYIHWGKMDKAILAFDQINPAMLSKKEAVSLLLKYGNLYYLQDDMETSYQYYKLVSPLDVTLQSSFKDLYQYGISAYKSKAFRDSREVLFILHNKYPKAEQSLLALARIGDTLRLEGKIDLAKKTYKQVHKANKKQPDYKSANLVAYIGELHLAACRPPAPSSAQPALFSQHASCFDGGTIKDDGTIKNESARLALKEIEETTDDLLHKDKRSHFLEKLLYETAIALEKHEFFTSALVIKEGLLTQKTDPNLKNKVKRSIGKTAISAVSQLLKRDKNAQALGIFYQFRDHFTQQELKGKRGLLIGIGLTRAGLYQQAAALLKPIAFNPKTIQSSNAREALFTLTKTELQKRDGKVADSYLNQYIHRYPKDKRIPLLEILSAERAARHEKIGLAIKQYRTWLVKYRNHAKKDETFVRLGELFEKKGDFKLAVSTYLKVSSWKRKTIPGLDLKIADAFYRLKNYKKAIHFYIKTLQVEKDTEQIDWATFQLAQSYERRGLPAKGQALFSRLKKNSENILIKSISAQKAAIQEKIEKQKER